MLIPDNPIVFLALNALGSCFLVVGWWYFEDGIRGDFRQNKEGVAMTKVPTLWAAIILFTVGAGLIACAFSAWF